MLSSTHYVPILFEVFSLPASGWAACGCRGLRDASQLHLASYGSGAVSDPSRVSLGGEGIWRKVTSQWYSSVATAQLWAPPPRGSFAEFLLSPVLVISCSVP